MAGGPGVIECAYQEAADSSPGLILTVRTDRPAEELFLEADALPRTSVLVGVGLEARYSTIAADPDLIAVRTADAYFDIRVLRGEAVGRLPLAELARLVIPRLSPVLR